MPSTARRASGVLICLGGLAATIYAWRLYEADFANRWTALALGALGVAAWLVGLARILSR